MTPEVFVTRSKSPIGNTAAVTCISGWLCRAVESMYQDSNNQIGELIVTLNTPAETLHYDLFVHRSLIFAMNPQLIVYSQLPSGPIYPKGGRDRGILPIRDAVIDLGNPPFVTTAHIPRYRQLLETVCTRGGWKLDDFHGYRFKLKYPPIPALALFRFPLLPRP